MALSCGTLCKGLEGRVILTLGNSECGICLSSWLVSLRSLGVLLQERIAEGIGNGVEDQTGFEEERSAWTSSRWAWDRTDCLCLLRWLPEQNSHTLEQLQAGLRVYGYWSFVRKACSCSRPLNIVLFPEYTGCKLPQLEAPLRSVGLESC